MSSSRSLVSIKVAHLQAVSRVRCNKIYFRLDTVGDYGAIGSRYPAKSWTRGSGPQKNALLRDLDLEIDAI